MHNLTRIVAAVVDTRQATFYKEDGTTIVIPQGDTRLAPIIRQITPIISRGAVALVNFNYESVSESKVFNEYEERSSGLVKFFRVAKNKLTSFFGSTEGSTPVPHDEQVHLDPLVVGQLPVIAMSVEAAIEEIMAHAVPLSKGMDRVALAADTSEETVIAVMGNTVIPDVHKLEAQFQRSNEQTDTVGMQRFMERLAAVADKRSHSVKDLMRFMQRGDLPVAEDGSIVIYKILRKANKQGFNYVDCHSGNVPQRTGTYVHMDPSLVDHNRRNECSNGLHVARRGYLSGFPGDVVTICKVAPEDVIAVPDYDANKMRVCGYHILFELPQEDFGQLRNDKPLSTDAGKQMLADALAGRHRQADTHVKITAHKGGGIKISQFVDKAPEAVMPEVPDVAPTILETHIEAPKAELVDIRDVAAEVTEISTTGQGRIERAQELLKLWQGSKGEDKIGYARMLKLFKRGKKVGWDKLHITAKQAQAIEKDADK